MIDTIARPWVFLLLILIPFVLYRGLMSYADRTRQVKRWVAWIRGGICVLIILELVGITLWWTSKAGDEYVCYLVDVSDSITAEMKKKAAEQVAGAVAARGTAERTSLVLFADSPRVAFPFGSSVSPEGVAESMRPFLGGSRGRADISGQRTNIARALGVALSGFPAQAQKKIVLLTDGNQTDGDVLQQAEAAVEQNVQICPVGLGPEGVRDVVVASVSVPERIKRDEAFEIRCELRSTEKATGMLKLYVDEYLAEARKVELVRGASTEVFRRTLQEGGSHLLRARFEADFEQPSDNDMAYCTIKLPGRPRVLIIARQPVPPLEESLRTARFRVEQRSPVGAPRTMLDLVSYDAIVVDNVPASEFGENRLQLIRDYVGEFGGGLVLTGGRDALGAGGYSGTAIAEASPVAMEISQEEKPSTSIVIAVDDSRSMWLHGTQDMTFTKKIFGEPPNAFEGLISQEKAEFVKEVVKRVILALTPRDRVGAVGMSSDLLPARWYIRPQRVTDKNRLVQEFGQAFSERTYSVLYPTLDEARFTLTNDPATYRQVLLLTDGYVQSDENYMKFAMMLLSDGVSLSTVGVGNDSNHALLEEMARWGGGRYYAAGNLKELGEVYEKELQAPATQLVVERPVSVAPLAESAMLAGLDMNLAPVLFGYVRTRPKASARVSLNVEGTSDPLLAAWDYGAGKVAVFTSAAAGTWATLWVKDWEDGYSRFWRQTVSGVLKEPGKEIYQTQLVPEGLHLRAATDVLDANDNFVNATTVSARLFYLGERGDIFSPAVSWNAVLPQKSPGRYEHVFDVDRKGVYLVRVRGETVAAGAVETTGAIIPAPQEQLEPIPNISLLESLAQVTRGKLTATVSDAVAVEGLKERRRHDLGFYAMVLAGLLLAAEVVLRRWPAFAEFLRVRRAGQAPAARAS